MDKKEVKELMDDPEFMAMLKEVTEEREVRNVNLALENIAAVVGEDSGITVMGVELELLTRKALIGAIVRIQEEKSRLEDMTGDLRSLI